MFVNLTGKMLRINYSLKAIQGTTFPVIFYSQFGTDRQDYSYTIVLYYTIHYLRQ